MDRYGVGFQSSRHELDTLQENDSILRSSILIHFHKLLHIKFPIIHTQNLLHILPPIPQKLVQKLHIRLKALITLHTQTNHKTLHHHRYLSVQAIMVHTDLLPNIRNTTHILQAF